MVVRLGIGGNNPWRSDAGKIEDAQLVAKLCQRGDLIDVLETSWLLPLCYIGFNKTISRWKRAEVVGIPTVRGATAGSGSS